MKTTYLISFLFILFSCQPKETETDNDLSALNLKGNIKSVTTKNYLADDQNGQLIKGPQASRLEEVFDKKGNLIKSIGGYSNEVERKYCEKGLLQEEVDYYNNKVVRRFYYKYDENNREIEAIVYGQGGLLEQKRYSYYDSNGFFIEMKALDGKNKLIGRITCENDTQGRELKKTYFNENNQEEGVYIYMYDEAGRKILDQAINKNEKDNSLQKTVYNEDGYPIQNVIKTWYEDKIIEYDYVEYDDFGNWVVRLSKEKKLLNNQPTLVPRSYEEREIAYY